MKYNLLNDISFWKRYKALVRKNKNPRLVSDMELIIKEELFSFRDYIIRTTIDKFEGRCDQRNIISFANFGLHDAIRRYNPNRGWKFTTYAATRVRGAIIDAIREESHIPRAQSDDYRILEKIADDYYARNMRAIPDDELKRCSGLSGARIREVRDTIRRLQSPLLNSRKSIVGDEHLLAAFGDKRYSPERIIEMADISGRIDKAIRKIPESYGRVVVLYFLLDKTGVEIAKRERVSEALISIRRVKAIKMLKEQLATEYGLMDRF